MSYRCPHWCTCVAVSLAVACSAAIGVSAADANVIAHVGGSTVMVSVGSGTLEFYWKQDGSSTWHPERVPSNVPVVTNSPAVAQVGNSSVIAAEGTDGSLQFYWQAIGSPRWADEQVAGPGTTTGAPEIAQVGNSSVIAAPGPNGTIDYYYQPIGAARWSPVQIVSNASEAPRSGYGWPSIAQVGSATVIVAQGPSASLWRFSQPIGSPTWSAQEVAGKDSTYTRPSVTQMKDQGVDYTLVAAGSRNQEFEYEQAVGEKEWGWNYVNSDLPEGANDASVVQVGNDMVLTEYEQQRTSTGEVQNALWSYTQIISTTTWKRVQVTPWGGLPGGSDPGVAADGNEPVLGVALPNGGGLFYWISGSWQRMSI